MTTIAYRDGVLAADSLITSDGMRAGCVRKVAQAPDGTTMGAMAGPLEAAYRFLDWVEAGAVSPCPKLEERCDGILVRAGQPRYVGPDGIEVPFRGPYAACGSGERYAMGAMAMGADARRAVEVAIDLDVYSGGDIVVVTDDSAEAGDFLPPGKTWQAITIAGAGPTRRASARLRLLLVSMARRRSSSSTTS